MRRAGTPGSQPRASSVCDDPRGSLGCVLPSRGGGEAECGTWVLCSPWSSSPSPRRSPGHLNPKQASLQLATGLSERQGES